MQSNRVLLVDDSPFFRNLLQPLLSVAGYNVITAESPEAAFELCEAGESFDVIVFRYRDARNERLRVRQSCQG